MLEYGEKSAFFLYSGAIGRGQYPPLLVLRVLALAGLVYHSDMAGFPYWLHAGKAVHQLLFCCPPWLIRCPFKYRLALSNKHDKLGRSTTKLWAKTSPQGFGPRASTPLALLRVAESCYFDSLTAASPPE